MTPIEECISDSRSSSNIIPNAGGDNSEEEKVSDSDSEEELQMSESRQSGEYSSSSSLSEKYNYFKRVSKMGLNITDTSVLKNSSSYIAPKQERYFNYNYVDYRFKEIIQNGIYPVD